MWVRVEGVQPFGRYVGRLDNKPVLIRGIRPGDAVVFDRKLILDVIRT